MAIHILAIPGMGTQEPGFSNKLKNALLKFTQGIIPEGDIHFKEVLPFHEVGVDAVQRNMYERIKQENYLDFEFFRKFAISAFGDAATFERAAKAPNSVYKQIHRLFKLAIEDIDAKEEDILAIVASSLGVHLISTYIYDSDFQKGIFEDMDSEEHQNCNLSNLNYLASIGCNIPLFISGIPPEKIRTFDKSKRAPNFKWENYYDRDDVLGWPLKQLCKGYSEMVDDFEINSGFTPMAHVKYWDDKDFVKPFSDRLIQLWRAHQTI